MVTPVQDNWLSGIDAEGTTPIVTNNTIVSDAWCSNYEGAAVQLAGTALDPTKFTGNTVSNSGGCSQATPDISQNIDLVGTLAKSVSWPTSGLPWIVGRRADDGCFSCQLTVAKGVTLTLPAGASVPFDQTGYPNTSVPPGSSNTANELLVAGTLTGAGTASAPTTLEGTVDVLAGGTVSLPHTAINDSNQAAYPSLIVRSSAGSVAVHGNLVGVPNSSTNPMVVYAASGTAVNVTNSWWGQSSGPAKGQISGSASYKPWLTSKP